MFFVSPTLKLLPFSEIRKKRENKVLLRYEMYCNLRLLIE